MALRHPGIMLLWWCVVKTTWNLGPAGLGDMSFRFFRSLPDSRLKTTPRFARPDAESDETKRRNAWVADELHLHVDGLPRSQPRLPRAASRKSKGNFPRDPGDA